MVNMVQGMSPYGAGYGWNGITGFDQFLRDFTDPQNRPMAMLLVGKEIGEALATNNPQQLQMALGYLRLMEMADLMRMLAFLGQNDQLAQALGMPSYRPSAPSGPGGGRPSGNGPGNNPGGNSPVNRSGATINDTNVPSANRYPPGSPEARALFREAARLAGVPESWADSQALHNILSRESGGVVGRPNYTYGSRARDESQWGSIHDELRSGRITARSSATGLGQLLLSNVDRYYPNGRAGIGDPLQEAAGMLAYIKDRYGSPEVAWARYNTLHEGY